jgi:hypothetical protein
LRSSLVNVPIHAGSRHPYNFVCWTIAFLPGFAALLRRARGRLRTEGIAWTSAPGAEP